VVGDFNGDGKLDLATANPTLGTVSVLLGNGDGTFQAPITTAPIAGGAISLAAGDFNGDHKLDLVMVNNLTGSVTVLLGNGNGTFQAPVNYAAGAGRTGMAAVDLDGDGIPDILTGPGPGGGPDVRAFDGTTGHQFLEFLASEPSNPAGVFVGTK
jgi:hypothetical protein